MTLNIDLEKQGNWLFKRRSFLPLLLFIPAFFVIFLKEQGQAPVLFNNLYWVVFCLAISLLGLLIRIITIGYTPKGTSGRNTKEGQIAESLNTTGIYATVRHPLYLGNFLMWLGLFLYVGHFWFVLVCCLLFWIYYERIMYAEEAFLKKQFGSSYEDWAKNTPAFFPRIGKYTPPNLSFSIKNVLKREYNGFLNTFLSFGVLNFVHNIFQNGAYRLDPFWQIALSVVIIIYLVIRIIKKRTTLLEVAGR